MPGTKIFQINLQQQKSKLIFETKQKLEEFRNEASCWYCEPKAFKLLTELKGSLLQEEYLELAVAFSHFRTGEDKGDILHNICNKLIKSYQHV